MFFFARNAAKYMNFLQQVKHKNNTIHKSTKTMTKCQKDDEKHKNDDETQKRCDTHEFVLNTATYKASNMCLKYININVG